ncbi:MAG: hypothetical protein CSB44_03380 [Gammaproteobacteria bacterium]|nr:MAG: hypothetical protein CSB44_03380 [Gammaproteobacteria bacterium]
MRQQQPYSVLYFLKPLGAGGLAVSFFMYLMFWVPHPNQPVPVFEDIAAALRTGSLGLQIAILVALVGIAVFAFVHVRSLLWNLSQLRDYRQSPDYNALVGSNAQTQLKAIPLTLAMSVNVGFIVGLVFVPRLWSVVEYLFPLAIIAFVVIGIYALRLFGQFIGRVLADGGFEHESNNSLAQLLPAFALSMVAVGLAAPSAMSQTAWVVGLSFTLATFFMIAAVLVMLVALVLGFQSMVQHGAAAEGAPTLMIVIPIVTVLSIAMLRQNHGLHAHFDLHLGTSNDFVMLSRMLAVQILFLLLGWAVLKRQRYAERYLTAGGQRSPGSYALICPGVALSVLLHFFVNKGLVGSGLITKFGAAYWVASLPALAAQVATIILFWQLHRLHFGSASMSRQQALTD